MPVTTVDVTTQITSTGGHQKKIELTQLLVAQIVKVFGKRQLISMVKQKLVRFLDRTVFELMQ